MYPKITSSGDCHRTLFYNANKVAKGNAILLYAANFILDTHQLTIQDKLQRFDRLNDLNHRSVKNTFHISLNFGSSEKISGQKMTEIAAAYMEGIGFGQQPYLVYQHLDVAHTHCHIVASNIRPGVRRLPIYKYQSELVRRDIERIFGLEVGAGYRQKQEQTKNPQAIQKIHYGQTETKGAIAGVLQYVLYKYKFTSLSELNDVLKLYNVRADPGRPGSRVWAYKGLTYRVLDQEGRGIGARVKASSFSFKPTLANLHLQFLENKIKREPDLPSLRSAISHAIRRQPQNWQQFQKELKDEKIVVVPHLVQNQPEEINFIDLGSKTIVSGNGLGQGFSPDVILAKLRVDRSQILNSPLDQTSNLLPDAVDREQRKQRGRSI